MQKVQFIVEAIDNASKPLNDIIKNVNGVSEQTKVTKADIAAAGTVIIGTLAGIATKAVDVYSEFEKTMSGVKAVLQPTADEFQRLSEKARQLGRDTAYSATESALAIEMLAKNGLDTTQIMEGAIDSTLALAAATGADLSTAADIASSAMLSFGMKVEDLDGVVNGITGTTNVSKFGINDYALALAQGGGVAKAVGVSFKDFNTSIAAISPLFQSGSDAGTSFKTFLLRMIPASKNAHYAMEQLGIITEDGSNKFFDATGKMRSMADISQVMKEATTGLSDEQKNMYLNMAFGTDAMRAAAAMADTGAEQFNKLQTAIEGTDAAEIAATRLDNLKGSFEVLKGSVDDILISLGVALTPAIRTLAEGANRLANQLSELIKRFGTLPEPVQDVVTILGSVVVGVVALSAAAAILTVTMGGVAAAFSAILVAAAPWIAIAAAVALAVYGIYKAFIAIRDNRDSIVSTITTGITAIGTFFQNVFNAIKSGATIFREFLKALFQASIDVIVGVVGGFIGTLVGIFTAFYQLLTGDREAARTTISTTFYNVRNEMIAFFQPLVEFMKTVLSTAWGSIKETFTSVRGGIKTFFLGIRQSIKDTVKSAIDWLVGFFSGGAKAMLEQAFTSMLDGFVGIAKTIINSVIDKFEGMINFAIDGINKLIEAANAVSPIKIGPVPRLAMGRLAHGGIAGRGLGGSVQPIFQPMGAYAHGGIIGGERGIDRVPILASEGELLLNAAQQGNLASQLDDKPGNEVNVFITGNTYYGTHPDFIEQIGQEFVNQLKESTALQSF